MHNIDYALKSKQISDVFITTDLKLKNSLDKGFYHINRPRKLRGDNASHWLAIKHVVDIALNRNLILILL